MRTFRYFTIPIILTALAVGSSSVAAADPVWEDMKGSYEGSFRSTHSGDPNYPNFSGDLRIELFGSKKAAVRESSRRAQWVRIYPAVVQGNRITLSAENRLVVLEYDEGELEGTYDGVYDGTYSAERVTDYDDPDLNALAGKTLEGEWFSGKHHGDVTMKFNGTNVAYTMSRGTTGSGNYNPWSSRASTQDGYLVVSNGYRTDYFRVRNDGSEIELDGFYEVRTSGGTFFGNIVAESD